jgi:copper chaperone
VPTLSPPPPLSTDEQQLTYLVAGMTCDHCTVAVTGEVAKVAGVASVEADLDTKLVRIDGTGIDHAAVVAAIDEAGYDAVTA